MADREFGERLTLACDENENVPAKGRGRLIYLRRCLGVSHESVRKWLAGESRPKPTRMRELSDLLNVDEAWLSLAARPTGTPLERKERNSRATGIANVFMGLLQLNGVAVAVPSSTDDLAESADFYAIIDGLKHVFYVGLGEAKDFKVQVSVPRKSVGMDVICGVQRTGEGRSTCEFILIPEEAIGRATGQNGEFVEVSLLMGARGYTLNDVHCPTINDFTTMKELRR